MLSPKEEKARKVDFDRWPPGQQIYGTQQGIGRKFGPRSRRPSASRASCWKAAAVHVRLDAGRWLRAAMSPPSDAFGRRLRPFIRRFRRT